MMKASAVAAALGLAASPAFGACSEDTINMATSDGEILITGSGQLYRVLPGYNFYSKAWRSGQKILICEDTLVWFDGGGRQMIYAVINKGKNNEHVSAFKR